MGEQKWGNNPFFNQQKLDKEAEIKELRLQIATSLWFQSFAELIEASAVTKLFFLEERVPGGEEVVQGVWIQVIGQIIETIGVSQQLLSDDTSAIFKGQRTVINGDWMQGIGAILEATGEEQSLRDALRRKENDLVL